MLSGKNTFPGVSAFMQTMVYRSMGGGLRHQGEQLGAGFMHKDGVGPDFTDERSCRYVMVLVLRGRGCFVDDSGMEYPLEPGMFFQRLPGVLHSDRIDPHSEWAECYLEIGERFASALVAMDILRFDPPVGRAALSPELLRRIWSFMCELADAPEAGLPVLAGRMIQLLNEAQDRHSIAGPANSMDRCIELACRRLGDSFSNPFDLNRFCHEQGCGYENFRKRFREKIGISPGQYRIRRRLDAAVELLNDRRISIEKIAERLGYSSPYEFSAQFKRKFGRSPRAFRGNIT